MDTMTADEVIIAIQEVLIGASGEFIAEIANSVLAKKVTYVEDSIFTVEEE